jgi:hypothetical protein
VKKLWNNMTPNAVMYTSSLWIFFMLKTNQGSNVYIDIKQHDSTHRNIIEKHQCKK